MNGSGALPPGESEMNRLLIFALASTSVGVAKLVTFAVDPPVNLQSSTPGTAQVGHINVTGTVLGGTFFGQSAGTTTKVVSGWATSPTGYVFGGDFRSTSTDGRGIFASATATTGFTYGGDLRTASVDGCAVFGFATNPNGQGIGGDFRSDAPYGTGVIGRVNAVSGVPIGVYGIAPGNGFAGKFDGNVKVNGNITATSLSGDGSNLTNLQPAYLGGYYYTNFLRRTPFYIDTSYSSTPVIAGENSSTSTASSGVFGYSSAPSGNVRGVEGKALSGGGIAVFGDNLATSGAAYGLYGRTASDTGRAVYGRATASTGSTYAVLGQADSTNGVGVFGETSAVTGSTQATVGLAHSPNGKGVNAFNTATTGTPYGLQGYSPPAGYGVFCNGNSATSGTKSFRIDLPSDPANKYLLHYSTESPYPQNFYTGNTVTDSKGYAWVELPPYFEEINTQYKYQLTVVDDADAGGFTQVKISKKIRGNRFQIRSSQPNVEVSWRVEADRNDPYVRMYPPRGIVEKDAVERGTYSHPELYGEDPSRGLAWLGMPKSLVPTNHKTPN